MANDQLVTALGGFGQGLIGYFDKKAERDQRAKDKALQMAIANASASHAGKKIEMDENGNYSLVDDKDAMLRNSLQKGEEAKTKGLLEGRDVVLDDFGKVVSADYSPNYVATQKELVAARAAADPLNAVVKGLTITKTNQEIEKGKREAEEAKAKPKGTPDQFQAAGFSKRMFDAEKVFNDLEKGGYNRADLKESAKELMGQVLPAVKGNNLVKQEQAERNFVNATLRRESGSAINPSEFASAEQQYFPRPGDTPEVLEQKKQNRLTVMGMLKAQSGQAFEEIQKPGLIPEELGLVSGGILKNQPAQSAVPQEAAQAQSDTVKVNYNGKILQIPASRLQEALKDGAEVVK